jgi:uncharacterized protein
MESLVKAALVAVGTLFVALGILGMFLPVLPTTPFLLLAAFCYSRSSSRFLHWLTTNRWCGSYIRNYREGRGIPMHQKVATISLMWLSIGWTVLVAVSLWWVRVLLLGIAVGVTIHLFRMKTIVSERRPAGFLRGTDAPEEAS